MIVQTGTLAAVNATSTPVQMSGTFNVSAWNGNGTLGLQRSFDGGTTWLGMMIATTNGLTPLGVVTGSTGGTSIVHVEPETGVLYRLIANAFNSGPINYRVSQ